MILDPNSTVQPEMTLMLSHKRAICDEVMCMCTFNHAINFENGKTAGLEQTISRSGLNSKYKFKVI